MFRDRTNLKKGKRFTDSTRKKKQNRLNLSLSNLYSR